MSDEHAASACTTESDGLLRDAVTRERSETTVGRARSPRHQTGAARRARVDPVSEPRGRSAVERLLKAEWGAGRFAVEFPG